MAVRNVPSRALLLAVALLCVLILLLSLASITQAQRLPSLVKPEHYVLTVLPDLAAERFRGTTVIRISFQQPTSRIVLHAVDLDIDSAVVRSQGVTHRVTVSSQPDAETITLDLAAPLPPPEAEVMLSYSGPLRADLRGFYISSCGRS